MIRKFLNSKCLSQRLSQLRFLNLQEYQSKSILKKKGCNVEAFVVVDNVEDVEKKLKNFDRKEYVVKAQILAGGRGRGHFVGGPPNFGGVIITKNKDEVVKSVKEMIGKKLVTKQTDPSGVLVKSVMVTEAVPILRETYLAILLSRVSNGPLIIASSKGGMNIEELAKKHPEDILKVPINIQNGITNEQAEEVAKFLEFKESMIPKVVAEIKKLYELFLEVDATQIEINPLAETDDGNVKIVDAKLNFDDSAAFRQKEIFALGTDEEQDPREVEAKKCHLHYIRMDGNIACFVNGAGLAMATMDIIKHYGGEPANFLDVGGSVSKEQVYNAFQIFLSDPNVKGILVNIFGGIVDCYNCANGIIEACKHVTLNVPLVVRLEGTNVETAKESFEKSGLPFITACDLDDAAQKIVAAINKKK